MYKNYEEIRARCESLGGYTPEPKSQLENDFLHSLPIATNFYLGMRDNFIEGIWIWEKDLTQVMWNKWNSQPNDEAKDCSVMSGVGSMNWDNVVCGTSGSRVEVTIVCERGKGA